jgi:hypothetical protein
MPTMTVTPETLIPCSRCGGAGKIVQFWHVEGGICFQCRGRRFVPFSEFGGQLQTTNRPAEVVIATYILDNNEIEDEADLGCYTFEEIGPDTMLITPRYSNYPEWEIERAQRVTKAQARVQWKNLLAAGFTPRAAR